jgi:hypothetical protein
MLRFQVVSYRAFVKNSKVIAKATAVKTADAFTVRTFMKRLDRPFLDAGPCFSIFTLFGGRVFEEVYIDVMH